jgi:hypothetical protein
MSLNRPGRKQTTATKLGIHTTFSPRSSINSLARCSNSCQPLKNFQKFVLPSRSPRHQWPARRTKRGDFTIFYLVHGTGGILTWPDSGKRVSDQGTGSPGRSVSSGVQASGRSVHNRARTRPLRYIFVAFILQNVFQLHLQIWVIIRVDSLALWKIIIDTK